MSDYFAFEILYLRRQRHIDIIEYRKEESERNRKKGGEEKKEAKRATPNIQKITNNTMKQYEIEIRNIF